MTEEQKAPLSEQEYLAQKYGDYFANADERLERVIEDRHGNKVRVWLREFSEEDLQLREEVMIDQSGALRSAKNQRRQSRRGVPNIKVKPSNRRRFDMIKGIADWDLTRPKRNSDGKIVFETEEDGTRKTDSEGYPIPKIEEVPCVPKEKMQLKGWLSEQMVREVRKVNDLPIEEGDEEEDDETPEEAAEADNVFSANFDMSDFEGDSGDDDAEEGSEDNVTPLPNQSTSQKPSKKSGGTSKSKPTTGSNS